MTGKDGEKRRHNRVSSSIIFQTSTLPGSLVVADEVSAGGFKATFYGEPDTRMAHDVTVLVQDEVFPGCQARVVWIQKNKTLPPTWTAGFLLVMSDEAHARRTYSGG